MEDVQDTGGMGKDMEFRELEWQQDELVFGQYRIQGLPKSQTKFTVSNCTKISKVGAGEKKVYNKNIIF